MYLGTSTVSKGKGPDGPPPPGGNGKGGNDGPPKNGGQFKSKKNFNKRFNSSSQAGNSHDKLAVRQTAHQEARRTCGIKGNHHLRDPNYRRKRKPVERRRDSVSGVERMGTCPGNAQMGRR